MGEKRKNENVHYLQTIKELDAEWREKGWWTCLFSGEPLGSKPDHHHLISRDNNMLCAKWQIGIVKRKWHRAWHNEPIDKLMSYPWWEGFLIRLKERCPDALESVLMQIENKIDKAN